MKPAAYYNEIDKFAAAWLRNLIAAGHIAPGDVDERSIEDVRPDDLAGYSQCHFFAGVGVWSLALRRAGVPDDANVWTGSCPCQPFSAAGKGAGFADERHLWPHFHWLIEQCRPPIVLGEQVASKDGLAWLDLVSADLEGSGYTSGAVDTCAAGFGAPHIRQRLYWLAHADGRNARAEREQRSGQQRQQPADGGVGGMADALPAGRSEWRPSTGEGQAAGSGGTFRLAHPASNGCWEREHAGDVVCAASQKSKYESGIFPNGAFSRGSDDGAGPLHGFWRDADWLLCRDGRWRPVVATHVALVDGDTPSMVRVRTGTETQKKEGVTDEQLQALRTDTDSEEVQQRSSGGAVYAEAAQVLRPEVHGGSDGEGPLQERIPQQTEGCVDGEAGVRSVQSDDESACPPSRSRPAEQRPVELEDVVRLLSPSLSLAELHGDRRTAQALQVLRSAIREAGVVLHAHQPIETVWSSIGKEAQDRLRLGFDASRWRKVVAFPLEVRASNRVGRLRAYGNAIVAPQAQAFIECALEAIRAL